MIYAICIPLYLILFLFHKKLGFLFYQLLIATVYLITLSYDQTLDTTLVLYMCFAAVPYIKYFKVFVGFSVYMLAYFIIHLVVSIVSNGAAAISVFSIRLAGLFIYYYIFRNIDFEVEDRKPVKNFAFACVAVVCEVVIFLIGRSMSDDGRLMLNYQCTVGCIATSTLLFLAYSLYTRDDHVIGTMLCMLILTGLACASGTRGYIVVSLAVTFVSLFLKANTKWRVILVMVAFLILIFGYQYIWEILTDDLRMGTTTGRRHSENLFVLKFMWERPLYAQLFGNGFGAVVGDYSVSDGIIASVSDTPYTYKVLHTVNGFHNFYGTLFYASGLIGILLVLVLYIKLCYKSVHLSTLWDIKIILITFLASYAFLLWYRWTATSGILEFAVFAYVIKNMWKGKILQISTG